MEVEAKEAAQRNAPGNSLEDEAEVADACEGEENQGEAVLAMMGALQVHLSSKYITWHKSSSCASQGGLRCKRGVHTTRVAELVVDETEQTLGVWHNITCRHAGNMVSISRCVLIQHFKQSRHHRKADEICGS